MDYPGLFLRNCDDCKKFIYDSNGPIKNPNGDKIPRTVSIPVKCKNCPKCINPKNLNEEPEIFDGFTVKGDYYFRVFRVAKYFGLLPKPGGIDQQDAFTLDVMLLLNEMFDRHTEMNNRNFLMRLSGIGR